MISNQTVEPSGSTFSSGTQRPGNGVAAAVRRHPLGAFLALSCLLSWWPAALYAGGWSPAPMFGCGPFLAALIVIGLTEGKPGVAALWRSMRTIRGATRFHLVAIAAPIVVTVAALGAAITIGATPDHARVALWTDVPTTFLMLLIVPAFGGAWEEPGFRGFALTRFETRFGTLKGQLVLGAFWVLWHAPLFLAGQILPTDIPIVISASIVIATLFHRSGNIVLTAMVFHASNNAFAGNYASQLFAGHDKTTFGLALAVAWSIIATIVAALSTRKAAGCLARPRLVRGQHLN